MLRTNDSRPAGFERLDASSSERYSEAVRLALGETMGVLGRKLKLTTDEQRALVQLIATHQIAMAERAMAACAMTDGAGRQLRIRKRKLDVAIRELVGEKRFAQFERYRALFNDGQSF
jgi:hypothetical protein